MRFTTFTLTLLVSFSAFSQDIDYARAVLDTLCSERYDGRGFYNNGERRAANFIQKEFEKFGLKTFEDSWFQKFKLSVSSIVGETKLSLDGNTLTPGADYIIDPASPTYAGNAKVLILKKSQLTDTDKFIAAVKSGTGKFIVIDQTEVAEEPREVRSQVQEMLGFLKFDPNPRVAGVIELVDKLTFTASQQKGFRPHLVVLKEKFPAKCKAVEAKVENKFTRNYTSRNVIGYVEGEIKDTFICIIGHYDHIGRMGDDVYFPGANDNASGIAMMLSLAKDLAQENQLKYSVAFIAFGAEEIGLVGSKYYTDNPIFPLENIRFLLNLDILGTGDDGIQVVNGKKFRQDFDHLVELNEKEGLLKQVKIRGTACNSDHCFFTEKGVPGFFIYTLGGVAHYHDIYDKSETLPLTEYNDLFTLLKKFILSK